MGIKNISDFVRQKATDSVFTNGDTWVILSDIEQRIKNKIEAVGIPLKDWNINIYRGILTGYNEAFIISGEKKQEILANCKTAEERKKTDELIRPILRGRDIKRYGYDFAERYLIATFPSRNYNIDDYPALKLFLEGFKPKLKQTGEALTRSEIEQVMTHAKANGISLKETDLKTSRKKTNNKWFETQDSISYWDDFSKQKIVWGNLNLSASYAIAPEGFFVNAPCPLITPANTYLLAILNSKLADFYIRILAKKRNGGYIEYKPMFIERLPVPTIPEKEQAKLISLVEKINNMYVDDDLKTVEKRIDNLIYEIYGLREEEMHFIDFQ
ncbi:MAG: hypothetical protein KF862_02045 [Chitinophagaceae bacterium]|nr:hypothetical protein [Chitinophagaceae bacterium]